MGEKAIESGIAKAEEWARKTWIVDPVGNTKPTGEQKKEVAMQTAIKIEPTLGKDKASLETLSDQIDAKLVFMRTKLSLAPPARSEALRSSAPPLMHYTGISEIPLAPRLPQEALLETAKTNPPRKR